MSCCKYCNKVYIGGNRKKDVIKHELYCSENPNRIKYVCDKCEREFEKRHALIGHKKSCGNIKNKIKIKKKNKIKIESKHECKYCNLVFDNGLKLGGHIVNCKKDPDYEEKRKNKSEKLSKIGKNRKLSQEVKDKISKSMKKYISENPDKVPYKLNHSSKESYPEKYFNELFLKEGIYVERYYYVGVYELDFCIPDEKIDIEIDGEQHFVDSRIKKSDENRNEYLENLGWSIIRIRWSEYQRLTKEEKYDYIIKLKDKIKNIRQSWD